MYISAKGKVAALKIAKITRGHVHSIPKYIGKWNLFKY